MSFKASGALTALLCFFLLFFDGRTFAEENAALFEYGSLSCDEWIAHSELTEAEARKWFVAAVTQEAKGGDYRIDILGQMNPDQIVAWADNYCRSRPLDGLAVAAMALINELAARATAAK
jgi:hypothetical protein